MKIDALGRRCLRGELHQDIDRKKLFTTLRAMDGVSDVVFSEQFVAIYFDRSDAVSARKFEEVLASAHRTEPLGAQEALEIPVRYDGEDLSSVAAWSGCSEQQVVALHCSTIYEVRFLGFLPGFAYMATVDERIAKPRLAQPRTRVPKNAVGIAGARTGIYPVESPGGWNLVGRVAGEFEAFSVLRGALLQPGMRVRFRAV